MLVCVLVGFWSVSSAGAGAAGYQRRRPSSSLIRPSHEHTRCARPPCIINTPRTALSTQEQSLLADLRSVVARALSGLDMFTTTTPGGAGSAGGGEAGGGGAAAAVASPGSAGGAALTRSTSRGGGAAGVTSPAAVAAAAAAAGALMGSSPRSGGGFDMLGVLSPTSSSAAAGVTSPMGPGGGGGGGGGGGVVRRSTVAEGVFSGLPVSSRGRCVCGYVCLCLPTSPLLPTSQPHPTPPSSVHPVPLVQTSLQPPPHLN